MLFTDEANLATWTAGRSVGGVPLAREALAPPKVFPPGAGGGDVARALRGADRGGPVWVDDTREKIREAPLG